MGKVSRAYMVRLLNSSLFGTGFEVRVFPRVRNHLPCLFFHSLSLTRHRQPPCDSNRSDVVRNYINARIDALCRLWHFDYREKFMAEREIESKIRIRGHDVCRTISQ